MLKEDQSGNSSQISAFPSLCCSAQRKPLDGTFTCTEIQETRTHPKKEEELGQ